MASVDNISLHEPQQSGAWDPVPNPSIINERHNRQRDLEKSRLLALVGSALSQFPIWGL